VILLVANVFARTDARIRSSQGLANNDLLEVIVKYNGDILAVGEVLNAQVELLSEDYAIFTMRYGDLFRLYNFEQVEYFELPKTVTYILEESLCSAGINPVQELAQFALTGEGVMIGVIDSGIDYTHPDFRNEDGSTRIIALWDQSIEGNPPAGFISGTLYDRGQIDAALASESPLDIVPSQDYLGHGTAVTGIAAGNGRASGGMLNGVAPHAEIVVVKLQSTGLPTFPQSTDIMRGIKFLYDLAESMNMPLAINLSYGTNDGSHDGSSLFEQYIDAMAGQWKSVICVAAGNEAASGHHFLGVVGQGETIQVQFSTNEGVGRLYMTLWKNFVDDIYFELIAPNGQTSGLITPDRDVITVILDNVQVDVIYNQPNHYSYEQEVYYMLTALDGSLPNGLWTLTAHGEAIVDGKFNIWLPTNDEVGQEIAFFSPDAENTITIPATVDNVISVGGYNANIDAPADFSGRGLPYEMYGQKPDLVAPAVAIFTTSPGGNYDMQSGTSVATPFVTGSAALMMQWGIVRGIDPFLYGQRVKAFLIKGASRDPERIYPNPIWGYGRLNLIKTMNLLVVAAQRGGVF
jgi:minor extracellular serine protease Vpr